MATSGSTNFATSRDGLIKAAYQNIGVVGQGATVNSTQYTEAAILLNMVVKTWNVKLGMPLWALKTGYILPIADTNSMAINSHCVTTYRQTTLTADSVASATTLTVDSITGILASDQIGIELDDGTIHWTTVSGSPSGSTITIASGVVSAASTGNVVYAYTASSDRVTRPLRVFHAYSKNVTGNSDTLIEIIAHKDYAELGTKTTESYPTQLYYDTQLGNSATFYWYPRFGNGDRVIVIRYHRPFEDFDASSDEPDFPQEWYLPLLWTLSWLLAPRGAVPLDVRRQWRAEAKELLEEVSDSLMEEGSVFFQPTIYAET